MTGEVTIEAGPAVFSEDRSYRYLLTREWAHDKPLVMFIGLNPSTADEVALDPTLRRCVGFAQSWGCGGFHMTNLFAVRSKDPDVMKAADDPVGPDNDEWLLRAANMSSLIVCAWGVHGSHRDRDREVYCMLKKRAHQLWTLGLTKDGHPKHPLYLRADTSLERYRGLRF